jgi:glycosyltransferase involved in cell wall biosynthesis
MILPKISIVTPSFNQSNFLEQTILSVISQNYPNLEYIIIDGGSTDRTIDIIKKYENYIQYWVSEPDNGQSDALNKGLDKCTGVVFNWINSDDYLEPGALHKVAQAFIDNPKALQICGYTRLFENGTDTTLLNHRCELFQNLEKSIVNQRINQQGTFYNLRAIKALGKINNSLHYVMDLELWLKFLCFYGQDNIILIDDLLAHFRLHPNSKTVEFEERFRKESNGVYHHLLKQLQSPAAILRHFVENEQYVKGCWNFNAVRKQQLFAEITSHYFFDFYKNANMAALRYAFLRLIPAGKIQWNKHIIRIFIKAFTAI